MRGVETAPSFWPVYLQQWTNINHFGIFAEVGAC